MLAGSRRMTFLSSERVESELAELQPAERSLANRQSPLRAQGVEDVAGSGRRTLRGRRRTLALFTLHERHQLPEIGLLRLEGEGGARGLEALDGEASCDIARSDDGVKIGHVEPLPLDLELAFDLAHRLRHRGMLEGGVGDLHVRGDLEIFARDVPLHACIEAHRLVGGKPERELPDRRGEQGPEIIGDDLRRRDREVDDGPSAADVDRAFELEVAASPGGIPGQDDGAPRGGLRHLDVEIGRDGVVADRRDAAFRFGLRLLPRHRHRPFEIQRKIERRRPFGGFVAQMDEAVCDLELRERHVARRGGLGGLGCGGRLPGNIGRAPCPVGAPGEHHFGGFDDDLGHDDVAAENQRPEPRPDRDRFRGHQVLHFDGGDADPEGREEREGHLPQGHFPADGLLGFGLDQPAVLVDVDEHRQCDGADDEQHDQARRDENQRSSHQMDYNAWTRAPPCDRVPPLYPSPIRTQHGRRAPRRHPQHRHHRPRRPWQDDARRRHALAERDLPRQRHRGGARHGLACRWSARRGSRSWPRTRRSASRGRRSISSIRRATPISAARSSARSRWSTGCCCWSTPPRGRCRRPASS